MAEVEHQVGELARVIVAAAEVEHQVGELAPVIAVGAAAAEVGELAPVAAAAAEVSASLRWRPADHRRRCS